MASFYENLLNTKNLLTENLTARIHKPKNAKNYFVSMINFLLSHEQENQLNKFNPSDLENMIFSIQNCLELIQNFYQPEVNFED